MGFVLSLRPVLKVVGLLLACGSLCVGQTTPAERQVAQAREAIAANPEDWQAYNNLARALTRRARETGDPAHYDEAQEALNRSLRIAPANFEAEKLRVWILLGKHDFAQAREHATALNRRVPDDLLVYAFLVDANVELGNYPAAEHAAQWLLDLRPGSLPALTRAAYLRELFGDIEGALDLMAAAYARTPAEETEDRAWILAQIAHLKLSTGNTELAELALDQALAAFPDYHYALAQMARVRTRQKRHSEAVELLRRLYRAAPHPENLYLLARAVDRAGDRAQAEAAFAQFEREALSESQSPDNANRELVFYYADRERRPREALRLARLEIARRQDVFTLDAYAWALYQSGQYTESRKQIEKALAVGIQDSSFYYHAGMIVLKMNDRDAARRYFKRALQIDPASEFAELARRAASQLGPT